MVDIAVSIVCYKNDKEVIEFAQKFGAYLNSAWGMYR